jgi:hypothetical protein
MAPEQISGDEVGTPADVFCWAATLVFSATGEPPFGQDTIPAVINRILHEEPDLGDLGGALRELVLDCLEKDPELRPGARQVLMRLLGHEESAGRPAPRSSGTDETAMLAAGSVRAAEADDELFDPDPVFGDDPVFDDDDAAGEFDGSEIPAAVFQDAGAPVETDPAAREDERLPAPAGWGADSTLPPDLVTVGEQGGPDGRGGLRHALAGSGRSAALAGAAALFVAIVVVSSVLMLGSGDNGKAGQKVSDPSAPPGSSSVMPSMAPPTTHRPEQRTTGPAYTQSPTGSPSPSETPTPSGSPTQPDTPTATTPTKSSPPPVEPTDPTPDPPDPPDPSGTPGPGTGQVNSG